MVLMLFVGACKKSEERSCFKGAGDYTELEIPLDSVRAFHMNEKIRYRFYQDDQRKAIIKGGENLVQHVDIDNRDNVLYVDNRNKCNFFRNSEDIVEVEIHYPYYEVLFFDATDSVVFEDTIISDKLAVEMRDGGGSLKIAVNVFSLSMVVSHGAGDFTLSGKADNAEIKVQNNGAANAIKFRSDYVFIYQNSTSDCFINLDDVWALIHIDGTGDVFHNGKPKIIDKQGLGEGQIIQL